MWIIKHAVIGSSEQLWPEAIFKSREKSLACITGGIVKPQEPQTKHELENVFCFYAQRVRTYNDKVSLMQLPLGSPQNM